MLYTLKTYSVFIATLIKKEKFVSPYLQYILEYQYITFITEY